MALNVVRYRLATTQTPDPTVETLIPFSVLDSTHSTGTVPVTALSGADLGKFQLTAAAFLRVLVGEDYNLDSADFARRVAIYHFHGSTEDLPAGDSQGPGSQDGFGNADTASRRYGIGDLIYAKVKMDADASHIREYQNNPPVFIEIELRELI